MGRRMDVAQDLSAVCSSRTTQKDWEGWGLGRVMIDCSSWLPSSPHHTQWQSRLVCSWVPCLFPLSVLKGTEKNAGLKAAVKDHCLFVFSMWGKLSCKWQHFAVCCTCTAKECFIEERGKDCCFHVVSEGSVLMKGSKSSFFELPLCVILCLPCPVLKDLFTANSV